MRILLVGEFSGLHRSLQAGLQALGHEAVLVSPGDGFKNYPADWSNRARWSESKVGNLFRQAIFRLTRFDISFLERGLRFWMLRRHFQQFDVVQLIHEAPIQTLPWLERRLLQSLLKQNGPCFLMACGMDTRMLQHYLSWNHPKNLFFAYHHIPKSRQEYAFAFEFNKPAHLRLHQWVQTHCKGFIASDLDYWLYLNQQPNALGLIPNPVQLPEQKPAPIAVTDKVVILLGINRSAYYMKGIWLFEEALTIIQEQFAEQVEIIYCENLPFAEYKKQFDRAHIVLDMVFSQDQGYNAHEAMARGKVVFTGAAPAFMAHYQLTERVAVDALPDVQLLAADLGFLITHPDELTQISARAIDFMYAQHHYVTVAEQYVALWNQHRL